MGGLKLADGGGTGGSGTWPLGGEVGNEVEAATWELRIFMAICLVAWRSKWSYRRNSRLDFRVLMYDSLMAVMLAISFAWMASRYTSVRSSMVWLAGGELSVRFEGRDCCQGPRPGCGHG